MTGAERRAGSASGAVRGMARPGRKKGPDAASGIVRAWRFLKPHPGYAAAFREMAAPPTGGGEAAVYPGNGVTGAREGSR